MNNNYVFNNITAHDRIGWDQLFQAQPTIPQYNYRLGYFFDEKQEWAVELNFDHTKYVVNQGSYITVTGELHGRNVDTLVYLNNATLYYELNNGANFFLFNLIRKFSIYTAPKKWISFYAMLKAGVGPVIPHVENVIFGNPNHQQFQLGGWNTGIEGTVRVIFFKYAYLEYCNKVDYARYSWLEIYEGRAHQNFGTYENIANIGFTFPLGKQRAKAPTSAPSGK
jgi:hypothetical protein